MLQFLLPNVNDVPSAITNKEQVSFSRNDKPETDSDRLSAHVDDKLQTHFRGPDRPDSDWISKLQSLGSLVKRRKSSLTTLS